MDSQSTRIETAYKVIASRPAGLKDLLFSRKFVGSVYEMEKNLKKQWYHYEGGHQISKKWNLPTLNLRKLNRHIFFERLEQRITSALDGQSSEHANQLATQWLKDLNGMVYFGHPYFHKGIFNHTLSPLGKEILKDTIALIHLSNPAAIESLVENELTHLSCQGDPLAASIGLLNREHTEDRLRELYGFIDTLESIRGQKNILDLFYGSSEELMSISIPLTIARQATMQMPDPLTVYINVRDQPHKNIARRNGFSIQDMRHPLDEKKVTMLIEQIEQYLNDANQIGAFSSLFGEDTHWAYSTMATAFKKHHMVPEHIRDRVKKRLYYACQALVGEIPRLTLEDRTGQYRLGTADGTPLSLDRLDVHAWVPMDRIYQIGDSLIEQLQAAAPYIPHFDKALDEMTASPFFATHNRLPGNYTGPLSADLISEFYFRKYLSEISNYSELQSDLTESMSLPEEESHPSPESESPLPPPE